MESKDYCVAAMLTLLFLFHLSIQTEGQSQTPGQNNAQNTIQNASSGSGRQRGSGRSSGSGLAGTLPPCKECFGHGRNPNSDPRCRLGCSAANDGAPLTPLPNIMHAQCSEGGSCRHDASLGNASHPGSSSRKLKSGLIIGTIVLCILIVFVVAVKRHKFSSVGVVEKRGVADLSNAQII